MARFGIAVYDDQPHLVGGRSIYELSDRLLKELKSDIEKELAAREHIRFVVEDKS